MRALDDHVFWMALAHLPGWPAERINYLVTQVRDRQKLSFAEFFEMAAEDWGTVFHLNPGECSDLADARSSLSDFSSLSDELERRGIGSIPFFSDEYPMTLKRNLKLRRFPPVLYVAGNQRLLQESTVTIAGSKDAPRAALHFIGAVVKRCSEDGRVLVAGCDKGMDIERMALDTMVHHHGRSIVVLPQGILASAGEMERYRSGIGDGEMLLLSAFPPRKRWSVEHAAACWRWIFGISEEIYIAESGLKDETRVRAESGMKSGRRMYVRILEPGEKSGNDALIRKGAVPADAEGNILPLRLKKLASPLKQLHFGAREVLEARIVEHLSTLSQPVSARQVKETLELTFNTAQLTRILQNIESVETLRSKDGALRFRAGTGAG